VATRKLTREEWIDAIGQWRRSGQTRETFCARRDLNPRRMEWWEKRLADASSLGSEAETPAFIEVSAQGEVIATDRLELEVGRVRVRIPASFDERVLARVLAVLEARR
jgi:hypothetical protein